MPELNGIDAARQIRSALPNAEVLVFTMHESEDILKKSLAAGARGYLVKSDASVQLTDAVEALNKHKSFVSSSLSGALVTSFLRDESRSGPMHRNL
jgi:DNA-binding NarL/FixJ family response regulator